jgi:3-hydroxymyristoyl/3-hydroxydecanoyl-(acyl carrier protein) dehydratase
MSTAPNRIQSSQWLLAPPTAACVDDDLMLAQLSPDGCEQLFNHGRSDFEAELARHCSLTDRPVRWLFADAGLLQRHSVEQLLQQPALEGLPAVLASSEQQGVAEYLLWVPEDLKWFDGHFPDQPILAAVVQLSWALHFADLPAALEAAFSHLHRLKFMAIVASRTVLKLRLTRTEDSLSFHLASSETAHSKGRFDFRATGGANHG